MGCNRREVYFWSILIIIGGFIWKICRQRHPVLRLHAAFILSVFIYQNDQTGEIPKLLVDAAVMTTIVMLIIGASSPYCHFVMSYRAAVGQQSVNWFLEFQVLINM